MKRAIYQENDFMTYRQFKEETFMSEYSMEFLKYARPSRSRLDRNSGRNSRSLRREVRRKPKEQKIIKFRLWSAYEDQVLLEKRREEEEKKNNKKKDEPDLKVTCIYLCPICMETSEDNPSTMEHLECGHHYHQECLITWMKLQPGKGERFISAPCRCPMCRSFIWSDSNKEINKKVYQVRKKSRQMTDILIKSDGIQEDHLKILKLKKDLGQVSNVLAKYMFFTCYDCDDLYYGGEVDCGAGLEEEDEEIEGEGDEDDKEEEKKKEHTCPKCFVKRNTQRNFPAHCDIHGDKFIAYKCRFCCSLADWHCFGTTRFCNRVWRKQSQTLSWPTGL